MFKHERHEAILGVVSGGDLHSVTSLADRFGVSTMTVRRDLEELETAGLVQRVHGGVRRGAAVADEAPLAHRRGLHAEAKARIAVAAADLVGEGDGVLLGGGSTVAALAERLVATSMTAVTDSLLVSDALRGQDGVTLHVLGGRYRHASGTMTGPTVVDQLARLSLDLAVVSASAVSRGWVCHNFPEDAGIVAAMRHAARRLWLLVDASKLEAPAVGQVLALDAVDGVVSDAEAADLRAAGLPADVEVRTAT